MRALFIFTIFFSTLNTVQAQPKVLLKTSYNNLLNSSDIYFDSLGLLANYNAIFFGETHTTHFEPYFKLQLIKYLNDHYSIHDVFMEVGYASAYLFNQFLATGDTSLFANPHLPYTWAKGNYHNFWMKLYFYNQALPIKNRIKIHGVDFERQEVFKVLLLLKPSGKQIPLALQEVFQHIEHYASIATDNGFDDDFLKRLKETRIAFFNNIEIVKQFYGDNFSVVNAIIRNNGPHTSHVHRRNQTMFTNMQETLVNEHIDKFVGFFGAAHTYYTAKSSLPNQINTLDAFRGKVVNISSVYFHAQRAGSDDINEFMGLTNATNAMALYDHYLKNGNQAVILNHRLLPNSSLRKSADYILLVNDAM